MIIDNDGNIIVTGHSYDNLNDFDFTTIKYNTNGAVLWIRSYDTPNGNSDFATAIAADGLGNIYVSGFSRPWAGYFDYTTVKYNLSGSFLWAAHYDGPVGSDDQAYDMTVDREGNCYVTGLSWGVDWTWDCATVKYDSAGVQQWVSRYDSLGAYAYTYAVVVDMFGNVYATGACNSMRLIGFDYLTIKYNGAGVQQWVKSYDGFNGGPDRAASIALDTIGNVFVTGFSLGNQSSNDIATIKYSQPIGIQPISSEVPNHFSLSQNYPNPFNPVTKIKFNTPPQPSPKGRELVVRLVIYDVLGREVATLVNEQLKPGTYEVEWNGINSPSGVYFYRLTAGSFTETKKMVLIK
jgi:hypothetical protein